MPEVQGSIRGSRCPPAVAASYIIRSQWHVPAGRGAKMSRLAALLLQLGSAASLAAPLAPAPTPQMIASPPSTLLPPGTTRLPLALATATATACRWDPIDVPFASMTHSFGGAGSTSHSTTLTGLSGTLETATLYVRCAAFPTERLALVYRSLPDTKTQPYPKLGNLWGNGNFRGHPEGLSYAAKRASLCEFPPCFLIIFHT